MCKPADCNNDTLPGQPYCSPECQKAFYMVNDDSNPVKQYSEARQVLEESPFPFGDTDK